MGARGIEVAYQLKQKKKSLTPDRVMALVWEQISRTLDELVSADAEHARVLSESYIMSAQDAWEANDRHLLYVFGDNAGTRHRTMAAYHHWANRALIWLGAEGEPQAEALEEHGVRVDLRGSLEQAVNRLLYEESDRTILYSWNGELMAAQRSTKKDKVRLVGDGKDVEGSELPATVRSEVEELVDAGSCPCRMCTELMDFAVTRELMPPEDDE